MQRHEVVGLDEAAAVAVEEETLRQASELTRGSFSADELETARAGLLSTIHAITDGIRSHLRFVEEERCLGLDRTPEELFEAYAAVTAAQVAQSVEGLQLDYAYMLAPSGSTPETRAPAATPSPASESEGEES